MLLPKSIQDLMKPPPGLEVDFLRPEGAPALVPHNGPSWQIFANPISVFIGGVAAVILELAEPSVRSGVWEHSGFRKDPVKRLRRTGYAAMITVYAPAPQAREMIAHVVRMHDKVRGLTPAGVPYHANDPHLLTWVHATALWGFTEAYCHYVTPLTDNDKSHALYEGKLSAQAYGAPYPPETWNGWEALFDSTLPQLGDSPIIAEFLKLMESTPLLPKGMRWMQRLLIRAAIEITPREIRHFPSLEGKGLNAMELATVRGLGRLAEVLPLRDLPPAQARKRMEHV